MKKIILFLMCILLTGCSTEVVLKIDEEKVSETIKISKLKSDAYLNGTLKEDIKFGLQVFEREYEYYKIEEFEENEYVGKTYKLSENIELWSEISHVRPCYEKFDLQKTENNISLTTSDEYRCGYLFGANDVTLIVESDLHLVSSNADKVDGKKLIWNINESNYKNKSISFNYKILTEDEKKTIMYNKISVFILPIVILIGLVIGFTIFKKNKESNKL